ncbi:MAG: ribosome biogenesis GTPase YlqF [Gammaproteobacteria bacterium]|nr:ribosome biogenesis GTPase YlqF [Gammaproteobacteria bacterium]
MAIHWYPGHMHKASKEIKEALPKVDLFIEILDARIPYSSENPMLAKLRGDKPCIKLLSKSDLADPERTQQWQEILEQERGVKTLAISIDQPEKLHRIVELIHKLVPQKQGKLIQAMITGIPNVGKSTLINQLTGRTIAKTGNEPAVTKGQQRIKLEDNLYLLDTPGVLWPKVENEHSSYRLGVTGAIKDTAMEYEDIAFYAAEFLLSAYPQLLKQRYELDELPETELELLEAIGRKRGCLRGGNRVDLNKVSMLFINELRAGTLGRITFESPEMRDNEEKQVAIQQALKEEKKDARKTRRKKK